MMPAFAVGMASYIVILEGIHLVTGRSVYLRISMYDPHLLGGVRRWRGDGCDHALSNRHQLESLRGRSGNVVGPLFA
jgi:hypothetical protein